MFPEEHEKTDPSINVPMPETTHERVAPPPEPVVRTIALESFESPVADLQSAPPDPFAVDSSPSHVSRKVPPPPPAPSASAPAAAGAPALPAAKDISMGAVLVLGFLVFSLCASATFAAVWAFYALV